jgi:hypothetical protein
MMCWFEVYISLRWIIQQHRNLLDFHPVCCAWCVGLSRLKLLRSRMRQTWRRCNSYNIILAQFFSSLPLIKQYYHKIPQAWINYSSHSVSKVDWIIIFDHWREPFQVFNSFVQSFKLLAGTPASRNTRVTPLIDILGMYHFCYIDLI